MEDKKTWEIPHIVIAVLIAINIVLSLIVMNEVNKGTGNVAPTQGDNEQQGQPTKVNVNADDDPFKGNKDAKVTVIEFSDFQCPFCRLFWQNTLPKIEEKYIKTGKIKFVYRDFPLGFHPGAQPAAEASECADEQGKFWEMHDKIFEEQAKQGQGTVQFGAEDLKKWAKDISGLDYSKWEQCLDSRKYEKEVKKDLSDGTAADVGGTPSFFINGVQISGAQPFEKFEPVIEQALKG